MNECDVQGCGNPVRSGRAKWCEKHYMRMRRNGQRRTAREWADLIGVSRSALLWRLNQGWPLKRALTQPAGPTGPKRTKKPGAWRFEAAKAGR